jgi:hypothetical protein
MVQAISPKEAVCKASFLDLQGSGKGTRLRRSLEARDKSGDIIRIDRARPEGYSADHVLHEL